MKWMKYMSFCGVALCRFQGNTTMVLYEMYTLDLPLFNLTREWMLLKNTRERLFSSV